MPRIMRIVAVVTMLFGIAIGASAQSRFSASSETPKVEVGLFGGLWNLGPSGPIGIGGRMSINRSKWFGTEMSVEAKHRDKYGPTQGALIVNARGMSTDHEGRAFGVFTAGAAIGVGAKRTVSPMLGIGLQTLWTGGIIAARGELQYFPAGLIQDHNKTRVTLSVLVAIR